MRSLLALMGFAMAAGQVRIPELFDGQPAPGQVASREFAYFAIRVPAKTSSLELWMTPTGGDPDMYLAKGFLPTQQHFDYSDVSWGPSCISIPFPEEGLYFYGLFGFGGELNNFTTSFQLNTQTQPGRCRSGPPRHLVSGSPMSGHIENGAGSYFLLEIPPLTQNIELRMTALQGDPDMYLARGFLPTTERFEWADRSFGSACIYIEQPQPGQYFYLLSGWEPVSRYSTVFVLNGQGRCSREGIRDLVENQLTQGSVQQGAMTYFRFHVPLKTEGLELLINPTQGDPDMFLARGFLPNRTHFDWSDMRMGPACIYVNQPKEGEYFFGVWGFQGSPALFSTLYALNQGNCQAAHKRFNMTM